MNEKVLRTLEYNKIMALLVEKADSEPGKALCRDLLPSTDLEEINQNQTETADALTRLFRQGSTSFGGNKDVGFAVRTLDIGSTLSAPELLKIAGLLDNVNRVKTYGRKEREDAEGDSLTEYFDQLSPLTQVAQEIRRCILAEDEIADDASPTLKSIRRQIKATGDKIHTQLSSMVTGD